MGFLEIPTELKNVITAPLTNSDMANLVRTCNAVHKYAGAAMYRNVVLNCSVREHESSESAGHLPQIVSLLRTLLQRPAYAQQVKAITFQAQNGEERSSAYLFGSSDRSLFQQAVQSLELPDSEVWDDAVLQRHDSGATMALVLAQCAQLESLSVTADFLMPNHWFPIMLQHIMGRSQLSQLSHVAVPPSLSPIPSLHLPTDTALALFRLPALRSLSLSHLADIDSAPDLCMPTSLHSLSLQRSSLDLQTLSLLLQNSRQLTTLVYDALLPSSRTPLNLDELASALGHVRESLTYLKISIDVFADEAVDVQILTALDGSLGSLAGFSTLTHLTISLPVLFGDVLPSETSGLVDVLPRGLQHLVICDDLLDYDAYAEWAEDGVVSALNAYLGDVEGLRVLVLDLSVNGVVVELSRERAAELVEMGKRRGVRCEVIKEFYDDEDDGAEEEQGR